MSLKLVAAFLVLAGCGGCGFSMAAAKRREEWELRQFLRALEYMECELQFRQTDLPSLCRMVSGVTDGAVSALFSNLSDLLNRQDTSEPLECVRKAAYSQEGLSGSARALIMELGSTLGCFDLPGQLRGIASVKRNCIRIMDELIRGRDNRLRSYQTLGLCAGAALAIIFI